MSSPTHTTGHRGRSATSVCLVRFDLHEPRLVVTAPDHGGERPTLAERIETVAGRIDAERAFSPTAEHDDVVAAYRACQPLTTPRTLDWRSFNIGFRAALADRGVSGVSEAVTLSLSGGRAGGEVERCPEEPPECTCAMSESSFVACERHGYDSTCPDCDEPWIDHRADRGAGGEVERALRSPDCSCQRCHEPPGITSTARCTCSATCRPAAAPAAVVERPEGAALAENEREALVDGLASAGVWCGRRDHGARTNRECPRCVGHHEAVADHLARLGLAGRLARQEGEG